MYRDTPATPIACPRCKKPMPPTDVTSCGCGTWVSAFAAEIVLTAEERAPNRGTRWWRRREPCPHCKEQMTLCNSEPGLLQGCEIHGYFIDADTVAHTSLARGVDHEAIERKRADEDALAADREKRLAAEQDRDQRKREKEEVERRLEAGLRLRLEDDVNEREGAAVRALLLENHRAEYERTSPRLRAQRRRELDAAMTSIGADLAPIVRVLAQHLRAIEDENEMLHAVIRALESRIDRLDTRITIGL